MLGVGELVLSADAARAQAGRQVAVRIDALKMEERTLETPALAPGSGSMRFGWQHSVDVSPNGRAWLAISRALETPAEEDSDVYFTIRDAISGASLGEAYVNLERMLKANADKVREERQVLDSKDRVIGRLRVTVQAVAALRAVKAGAPAGGTPPFMAEYS